MSVDPAWFQQQGEDASIFASVYSPFESDAPQRIAVAVSGGGDSMALLHVLAGLVRQTGQQLHAVTVDHGLRAASADEAAFVCDQCAKLGVVHETLRWERTATTGNLQDQARVARYDLMSRWAADNQISHVLLGHTATDQAETFLLRLGRASGIDGLSGMRPRWTERGVTFLRPFLSHERATLRDYLTRHEVVWIDDPSNEDIRFDRVKARQALIALAPLGISVADLNRVSQNLHAELDVILAAAQDAATQIVSLDRGDVVLDCARFAALLPALRRRLLVRSIMWVSSARYAPRARSIARVDAAITEGKSTTLGGCRITVKDNGARVSREFKAVRDETSGTREIWDGRWQLAGPHDKALEIRALGLAGLRACPDWRQSGLPRASVLCTPAVWSNDRLIAAPVVGRSNGWTAQIVADFHILPFAH
ncbi:tRNA lysidine(34) synthetase TilS [Yoonia sediminilitoris]|uniref:tRNA(Ile)-lysidine synthase n=1 Tax=Yoonia sediminilitoris TaxID=1286148 RepID=A0A2T6KPQ3_9RHOB|nr:tRNA lysidine(34) synthetase TilS [Yoonia sediminilitoris]PUB18546.1 tRNA(Ile)-lysidine synthase [Yoonia sediminilitoris]RCW98714.1 tRNA(Ile)-lysidine synthase [Yoonia sediminilitoris]